MNILLQIKIFIWDDIFIYFDVLVDIFENCVRGGVFVSFMLLFSIDKVCVFWQDIVGSVECNECVVLVCIDFQDGVIGIVQFIIDQLENQLYCVDVVKLLVYEKVCCKGVVMVLMEELEVQVRVRDILVLVLDILIGSGVEIFYQCVGW